MPILDYSKLTHAKKSHRAGYSVKHSSYTRRRKIDIFAYRGDYKGDYAVFEATHPKLNLYPSYVIKNTTL
jgi:hypothetical protein